MKHTYSIAMDGYALRPLELGDIEKLRLLRNTARKSFLQSSEISARQQQDWYKGYLKRENDYMFALTRSENKSLFLGAVALYAVNGGQAESGRIMVDKQAAPERGTGTAALRLICAFGFHTLQLRYITAEILPENTASIRIHEKAGYCLYGKTEACLQYKIEAERFRALYPELLQ